MGCAPFPVGCWPVMQGDWGGPASGILGLGAFVLWVWVLIDCVTKESDEGNHRLIWGLVVGFTYVVGAVIYLIVRRPQRIKTLGK